MKNTRFNNYDALKDYISELPPPKAGHVRVFRGQCKDHGNMRPTGVRIPLRYERVWRQYCRVLAAAMIEQQGEEFEAALTRSDLWAYWYYAIVQHYGPGTHLLDVSHSLDVGLWFALHRASTAPRMHLKYVSSGLTAHGPELYRRDQWTSYSEWREAPGILYLFDVPEWAPPELPTHGELVDLARGPEVFRRSARIQAQKGCLIAADSLHASGGDLTSYLAHPPLQVEWPMSGCEAINLKTEALFPSPAEDEWYAHLLFLPMVYQVWHEEPHWRVAHPVELSMYIEHFEVSLAAVQFKPLQPPLLYTWLISPALRDPIPDEATYKKAARFFRTVPILLEAPVLILQPKHDAEIWNHSQLVDDLPIIVGAIEWSTGEISDAGVRTDDVLFEFSPLECVGWIGLLKEGGEMFVPRAIHLVREDYFEWQLQVFLQAAPKERIHTLFKEPARFGLISRPAGFK